MSVTLFTAQCCDLGMAKTITCVTRITLCNSNFQPCAWRIPAQAVIGGWDIDSRLTNAIAEGLNRIIGIVRNRASGFRSVSAFIDLIYLTVGDVDIPAQIPARFRTL